MYLIIRVIRTARATWWHMMLTFVTMSNQAFWIHGSIGSFVREEAMRGEHWLEDWTVCASREISVLIVTDVASDLVIRLL